MSPTSIACMTFPQLTLDFMGRFPQLNNRGGKKISLMGYLGMLVLAESELFPYYRSIQERPQMTVMKQKPSEQS